MKIVDGMQVEFVVKVELSDFGGDVDRISDAIERALWEFDDIQESSIETKIELPTE